MMTRLFFDRASF